MARGSQHLRPRLLLQRSPRTQRDHTAPAPTAAAPPPPQALQEAKRDLLKLAFDRRRAQEVQQDRINDVRALMDM